MVKLHDTKFVDEPPRLGVCREMARKPRPADPASWQLTWRCLWVVWGWALRLHQWLHNEVREKKELHRALLDLTVDRLVVIQSPVVNDEATLWYTQGSVVVTGLRAVVRGSVTPSVNYQVRYAAERNAGSPTALLAADVTVGDEAAGVVTTPDQPGGDLPEIPAGRWVWVEVTAKSGTVDEFTLHVEYTEG